MNIKSLLTIIFLMTLAISISYSQEENCKVLKPELALNYTGKCKKGLADGKGIATGTDTYEGMFKSGLPHGYGLYKYADGAVYEGNFKNGMKNGIGKLTFINLDKDSTFTGIWADDKLVKKTLPPQYKIVRTSNVQRYSVQKIREGDRVMFAFMQNGMTNQSITNLSLSQSSGTPITIGNQEGFERIQFPFYCKVIYYTENSLRTINYDVTFEIEINEPGEWLVTLNN